MSHVNSGKFLVFEGIQKSSKILNVEGGNFRLREGNAVHIGEFKCTEYVINTVFIILRIGQSILGTRKVRLGQKDG